MGQTPTTWTKGKKKTGGRTKGTPNKLNADLKEMILGALNQAGGKEGGQAYLLEQAKENPTAFLSLVGKVLPMTVQGDKDNPLRTITTIELVAPIVARED